MNRNRLTVIDFFCGAGGFSEGFRQEGYEIVMGIDHWRPAMDTFNHNFNTILETKNILDYMTSIEEIEALPDTHVIIGSPPCVSFSNSNKSGKADKSLGVQLTECFLRIVAVKKHKTDSKLQAWFMENVVNSKRYLQPTYTFQDLKLFDWAKKNKISPYKIAIDLSNNSHIINSAEYGSIQIRKRVISGEIIKCNSFVLPRPTNQPLGIQNNLPPFKTIKILKERFPSPFQKKSSELISDPLYGFVIEKSKITDHFYDTGIYECDWRNSKYLKINHPYMGRMSFPEDIDKPSRTVTATKIANSRESLIYKTEISRKGNGEFRTPTVREAAIIMGFPITFQFLGSENAKWRMVGNAVCPSVSRALAGAVKDALNIDRNKEPNIIKSVKLNGHLNLNTYKVKLFDNPPRKNIGSRFRRHTFKCGNMTVALSNYDIEKNEKKVGKWRSTILYGTGEGYGIKTITDGYFKKLEAIIMNQFSDGSKFIETIDNGFSEKIAAKGLMQKMYEENKSFGSYLEPVSLMEEVARIISKFDKKNEMYAQNGMKIFEKEIVPKKQLYALYAVNKISSTANNK